MPWLIVVLGLALAACGGAAVVHGYPYMQIEFGWTEVIAGTTALSGGIVTFALGAVLVSLGSLRRSIERGSATRSPPAVEPASALPAAGSESPIVTPVEMPKGADLAIAAEEPQVVEAPKPEKPRDRSGARPLSAVRSPKPQLPPAPLEAPVPAVAGRYQSGGSSYVLFTDGTIEVESESGKRQFTSMEDLKSFMAQERPDGVTAGAIR